MWFSLGADEPLFPGGLVRFEGLCKLFTEGIFSSLFIVGGREFLF